MSILVSLGISVLSMFNIEVVEPPKEYFPEKQEITNNYHIQHADYYYSLRGELIETKNNDSDEDHFYVKINKNFSIPIDLSGKNKSLISTDIGYLARILSAETLTYVKKGQAMHIDMFTRVCIAESIKNRKESQMGFYANYNTFKDVILHTGYATYAKEFRYTEKWLNNNVAKKRFVEEVLPVAIFEYFNKTNFTNGATGFITPAKLSRTKYLAFQKRKLIEIKGIDPYYEFTFWKY
jgi:hypothetical protein